MLELLKQWLNSGVKMDIKTIIDYYGGTTAFAAKFKCNDRTVRRWYASNKCPEIILALFGYLMPTEDKPNKIRAELRDVERFNRLTEKGG